MINFRKIDRFYLSGGWQHVGNDMADLKAQGIKAVLDLQFIPADFDSSFGTDMTASVNFLRETAEKNDIKYGQLSFRDDEFNDDLDQVFIKGHIFLEDMEIEFPKKKDGILIKCGAGISRSPAMLAHHLCETKRLSYMEAISYIRQQERYQVEFGSSPNQHFADFLKKKFKDSKYETYP